MSNDPTNPTSLACDDADESDAEHGKDGSPMTKTQYCYIGMAYVSFGFALMRWFDWVSFDVTTFIGFGIGFLLCVGIFRRW
jgi:hypothetical protein